MKEKIESIASVLGVDPSNIQAVVDNVKSNGIFSVQDLCRLHSFGVPVLKKISEIYNISEKDAFALFDIGPMDYRSLEQVIDLTYEQFKPAIDEWNKRQDQIKKYDDAILAFKKAVRRRLKMESIGSITDVTNEE